MVHVAELAYAHAIESGERVHSGETWGAAALLEVAHCYAAQSYVSGNVALSKAAEKAEGFQATSELALEYVDALRLHALFPYDV